MNDNSHNQRMAFHRPSSGIWREYFSLPCLLRSPFDYQKLLFQKGPRLVPSAPRHDCSGLRVLIAAKGVTVSHGHLTRRLLTHHLNLNLLDPVSCASAKPRFRVALRTRTQARG